MNSGGIGPIEQITSYQIFSESSITLSLAWNCALPHTDAIAASSSDGQIAVFDTKYESPIAYTKTPAHSLEAWTLAWKSKGDHYLSPVLYSGGDDSALCRHGLSFRPVSPSLNDPSDGNTPSPGYDFQTLLRDTKSHMAGVTAILLLPLYPFFDGDHLLLTGSYDEYVRLLLPIDGCSRPKLLAEQRLGGGVWGLKYLHFGVPDRDSGKGISEQTKLLSNPLEARVLPSNLSCS